ncbi:MAG: alpha/beta hydrolase [Candidatus Nanopelagicales bacterium]
MTLLDPEEVVRVPGPWTHRDVAANGARFHVAEMGHGPLVLLLHGFPTFWWTWRHALPVLADAGFRAVAMDLRGYAGSDHPPRGYDPFTLTRDVTGVIRSLGERDAVVVGHGWGGFLAWTAGALQPAAIRAIAPVSMPHPRRLRSALLADGAQRRASAYAFGFQVPASPERDLLEDSGAEVGALLHNWSATPDWPDRHTEATYRAAMRLLNTAHCALEYHRWAMRSVPRPDGLRYASRMKTPIHVPVLQVQGGADPTVLPSSAQGSGEHVTGPYRYTELPGAGHFPHEEQPDAFHDVLLDWLAGL